MAYCRTCGEDHDNIMHCNQCLEAMERAVELPNTKRVNKGQQINDLRAERDELKAEVKKYQAEIISTRNDFHTTNEANLKRYAELEAERDELKRVVELAKTFTGSCVDILDAFKWAEAKAKEQGNE